MGLLDWSSVFSLTALHAALSEREWGNVRLILSCNYLQSDILEIIFKCRGALDIPFERSYALPANVWMLVDDNTYDNTILVSNPY